MTDRSHASSGWGGAPLVVGVTLTLCLGTVLVSLAFDLSSHSASDTLRPFLITMGPVWFITMLASAEVITTGAKKRQPPPPPQP